MPETDNLSDNLENIEAEMIKAWREFLDALNPYLKICGEILVKNIAKTVMQKIVYYVNKENTFTMNDEKIFEYFAALMDDYAQIAEIYGENLADINDLRVSEILHGISDVLSSQLKQYEEHMDWLGLGAEGSTKHTGNPIKEEKDRIVKAASERVEEALKIVKNNIIAESGYFDGNELKRFCAGSAFLNVNESHLDFFTFVYQRVIEKGGLDIYKSYSGAIMECAGSINSLDIRKETQYFYEALKEENENLQSIVKIQVQALEGDAEETGEPGESVNMPGETETNADSGERRTVSRIVGALESTLARTDAQTEELGKIFGEAGSSVKKPVLMNYDGFLSFIEEKGLCVYTDRLRGEGLESGTLSLAQLWKEKLDLFIRAFEQFVSSETKSIIDIRPYKMFVNEMRVKITDKLFLTEGIIKGFRELEGFYLENAERLKESVPSDYMKIIDGIHESVVIKIDSLEESKKSFKDETDERLRGLTPPDLTGEDANSLLKRKLNVWLDEMLQINYFGEGFADDAESRLSFVIPKIEEINRTEEYSAKMEKKISRETDGLIKLEASYLKDYLLFEIITFEEILTYSVSKLKECDNGECGEYVRMCEELQTKLVKLCGLHNILIITPSPFDTFNSSEHEVLVAEKTEGYKKGQIIKMMNSGFKYNEQVLVRANVIAAK